MSVIFILFLTQIELFQWVDLSLDLSVYPFNDIIELKATILIDLDTASQWTSSGTHHPIHLLTHNHILVMRYWDFYSISLVQQVLSL